MRAGKSSPAAPPGPALAQCLAALARGGLDRDGRHWRYARGRRVRRYAAATLARAVAAGRAVIRGGRAVAPEGLA